MTTRPERSDHHRTDPDNPHTVSRRAALAIGGAAVTSLAIGRSPAGASTESAERSALTEALQPAINPRQMWAGDLGVVGQILPEDDVRFLLVHHTASTNSYGPDEVVDQIRGFYDFHTSPEKGWPDVAYNFFVDRFGGIWEARSGSIVGPVQGDATGGSQGFGLLCSLIGDHSKVAISDEAQTSLVALLAWLAQRHQIDTSPGVQTEFVSRGSNRWPQGTTVTTNTISGHRDMSQTTCPGDFAYDLLAVDIPTRVSALRLTAASAIEAESRATTQPTTASSLSADPVESTTSSAVDEASASSLPAQDGEAALSSDGPEGDGSLPSATTVGFGAAVLAALAAGAARFRGRTVPD